MSKMILVVEDDPITQTLIKRSLMGYQCQLASSLAQARKQLTSHGPYDLVLLDVQLGDGTGFDFFQEIKDLPNYHTTPVIFLTAENSVTEKVTGLQLGADDYITKPFEPLELNARVGLRLKNFKDGKKSAELIQFGNLNVNLLTQRVKLNQDDGDEVIDLTALEFKILVYFIKHPDHVVSRAMLLDKVWSNNVSVVDRTIDSHISKLRKKLKLSNVDLESIYGEGYRIKKLSP